MPCTVTPLMINDFNSPFVDTNLLGGDNGVSGSGYLEHQRSMLWKPGKDEYFYMQFYKAILKGKEVCRSFTQYKSLRFLMQRVDDVGGIIKVVFDTGCGPYQSVQAASIYIIGWQTLEYRVPLDGLDLSKVRRILFYWKGYSPAKFYVDDIKFGC
ncbi:hypothetical protein HK098_005048 [Nowakowskiella sp. JEL0407]|nr:hypothetical protein HK098_005048 [Nowakowskiella sp. JEL0407]